jgi:shikimate dehydrogenase
MEQAAGPASLAHYAVLGNPVAHSRSPRIHALFAEQAGQPLTYGRELIGLDDFEIALEALARQGLAGANITVPFKTQAFALVQKRRALLTRRALRAESVNTIAFDHGQWRADNTDGLGLVADLQVRHGVALRGAAVLILGAGGAAQGVIEPLLAAGVGRLMVANRTQERAQEVARRFGVGALAWDQLATVGATDVIINATSGGLGPQGMAMPEGFAKSGLGRATMCYDMMYSPKPTAWLEAASQAGCAKCIDGLGMLVEQAAAAFAFWRGVLPATEPVYQQLRKDLAEQAAIAPATP